MTTALDALDRTLRLINIDCFEDSARHEALVTGLLGTTIRIESDRKNLSSAAGQTVLVALVGQLAMMGLGIDLAIPLDVPLIDAQPPVKGANLFAGLVDYGQDLIPGLRIGRDLAKPDLTFIIGDTATNSTGALRISGDGWTCRIDPAAEFGGMRWSGSWPLGALAAAGAATPEALRTALSRIAMIQKLQLAPTYRYQVGVPIKLDLSFPGCRTEALDFGAFDCISGGAITTSALYSLLRFPARGSVRIIEPDTVDISNLNRYPLMRRSHCGNGKGDVLASYSRTGLTISSIRERFTRESAAEIDSMASRVFVGVDHIPSRWEVQRLFPAWLCVGSTSHFFGLVSIHRPNEPCAACLHRTDEEGPDLIPTISFVSFWAGLLQIRYLIADLHGYRSPPSTYLWPFGLDGQRGIDPKGIPAWPNCEVGCPASQLAS